MELKKFFWGGIAFSFFIFLLFLNFVFSQQQNVCEPPPLYSFIKSYYEFNTTSSSVKLHLSLYGEQSNDQDDLNIGAGSRYQPIKQGYILISKKKENGQEENCYVVTDEKGEAVVSINSEPGVCYLISLKFFPDFTRLSHTQCESSIQKQPEIYKLKYLSSTNQLKFCVPGQKNQTMTLCWFSTIIVGLIFTATFIMGRNPLMAFDLGVSRSLPTKAFSSGAYYSPISRTEGERFNPQQFLSTVKEGTKAAGQVFESNNKTISSSVNQAISNPIGFAVKKFITGDDSSTSKGDSSGDGSGSKNAGNQNPPFNIKSLNIKSLVEVGIESASRGLINMVAFSILKNQAASKSKFVRRPYLGSILESGARGMGYSFFSSFPVFSSALLSEFTSPSSDEELQKKADKIAKYYYNLPSSEEFNNKYKEIQTNTFNTYGNEIEQKINKGDINIDAEKKAIEQEFNKGPIDFLKKLQPPIEYLALLLFNTDPTMKEDASIMKKALKESLLSLNSDERDKIIEQIPELKDFNENNIDTKLDEFIKRIISDPNIHDPNHSEIKKLDPLLSSEKFSNKLAEARLEWLNKNTTEKDKFLTELAKERKLYQELQTKIDQQLNEYLQNQYNNLTLKDYRKTMEGIIYSLKSNSEALSPLITTILNSLSSYGIGKLGLGLKASSPVWENYVNTIFSNPQSSLSDFYQQWVTNKINSQKQ